jgi:hypothetical protein
MGSFARRITIAIVIAGLISAASVPAMAQWVTQPAISDDAVPLSSPFGNSTDFRPVWPDFAPLSGAGAESSWRRHAD